MKTRSLFYSHLFAALAFAFTTCTGDKKEHGDHQEHGAHEHASGSHNADATTEPQFDVSQKFQEQLSGVFTAYVDVQQALVDSDPAKVKREASETTDALAKVDMKLITGAAHNDWMAYLTPMQTALKEIQSNDDIEGQRRSFSALSDHLYKSVKAFGLGGEEAYYTYCPMAFDNQGAYWLSDEEKVKNPYFGDKMLTCGEVKEKLK